MREDVHMADPAGSDDTGTPRWVKIAGVVTAVLVLLFIVLLLIGGDHGPGRHWSYGGGEGVLVTAEAVAR
ncbi:hypothetical protein GCM10010404_89580 [Nonomuraea africana]